MPLDMLLHVILKFQLIIRILCTKKNSYIHSGFVEFQLIKFFFVFDNFVLIPVSFSQLSKKITL